MDQEDYHCRAKGVLRERSEHKPGNEGLSEDRANNYDADGKRGWQKRPVFLRIWQERKGDHRNAR